MKHAHSHITRDLAIVAFSIFLAVYLEESQVFEMVLRSAKDWSLLGALVAGFFFTSVFTTAPAIVVLGEISQYEPLIPVALIGGLGAVFGDLIIFKFVKDSLTDDLVFLFKKFSRRQASIFKNTFFRWLMVVAGGIIIASPFPDEIGIALMGFSKTNTRLFMTLSYVFNFLGILAIGLVARRLSDF